MVMFVILEATEISIRFPGFGAILYRSLVRPSALIMCKELCLHTASVELPAHVSPYGLQWVLMWQPQAKGQQTLEGYLVVDLLRHSSPL